MQVKKIENQNINYGAKHFLSQNMRASISSLLIRMNAETNRIIDGDYFKSTITKRIHYAGKASFEDERNLTQKVNHKKQFQGFSVLTIGKKISMDIDNVTGEIIDFVKPFYKPWFLVIRQAEKILREMRASFYDKELMKKDRYTVRKLTPEGEKTMKQFVLKTEKQRLENIVKELEEGQE